VTVQLTSNGDRGAPSPTSVTTGSGSSVSGAVSDSLVVNGGQASGVLTGSTSGVSSGTVTIHA
jgi:hypothetical protein